MKVETIENNQLIAVRVPPGDKWRHVDSEGRMEGPTFPSLTDTLEAWFQRTGESLDFRLEPLKSKLYAIKSEQIEIKPEPIKTFSLYGEYSQINEETN